jgi:chemotaxis protein histidine kinase CheA
VENHIFLDGDGAAAPEFWEASLTELEAEVAAIEEWRARLFAERGDRLSVDQEAYDTLIEDVSSGAVGDPVAILARLRYLPARRLRDICRRYQYIVDSYRRTHGKEMADLHIATPDVPILPHLMRAMDSSIVQLLRNAVDHGIEGDDDRVASGKGPGRVTIEARYVQDALELTVADDGRGIDEAAVVAAAIRSGAVTREQAEKLTTEERVRLVLRSGVTTRPAVGQISGRGVGLDAVSEHVQSRRGTLRIVSHVGRGSAMTLRVPTVDDASPSNGRGG